jgi:hypothetical protein
MDISEMFFYANEQLRLKDLLPIDKDYYDTLDESNWKQPYSFEEWLKVLYQYGYDVNRIKRNKNPKSMRNYFYEGEYLSICLYSLEPSLLISDFILKRLDYDERAKEDFANKEYYSYFFSETNWFAIDYFIKHYTKISRENLYKVFKDMYVQIDYGFSMFPQDILDDVFSLADNTDAVAVLRENRLVNKEGLVNIYRGEGKRSTPIERTFSWTLSKDIANDFANQFEKGTIYQAKVKVDNIIDYIPEQNEEEIWVRYKDIEDMRRIDS